MSLFRSFLILVVVLAIATSLAMGHPAPHHDQEGGSIHPVSTRVKRGNKGAGQSCSVDLNPFSSGECGSGLFCAPCIVAACGDKKFMCQ